MLLLPSRVLNDTVKDIPNDFFRKLDALHFNESKNWFKEGVFIPEDIFVNFLSELFFWNSFEDTVTLSKIVLPVLSWRPTQDIITFDKNVYDSLFSMDLDRNMDTEIFKHFPTWSLWICTERIIFNNVIFSGFFATPQYNTLTKKRNINLHFVNDFDNNFSLTIELNGLSLDVTIEKIIKENSSFSKIDDKKFPVIENNNILYDNLKGIINLLIYICSYGIDDDDNFHYETITYPTHKKTKKGWRLFPPTKPNLRLLGKNFGDTIRKYYEYYATNQNYSGKSPAPHIRRAHWHHFWAGKKLGKERKLIVKWLPPIPVAMQEDDNHDII